MLTKAPDVVVLHMSEALEPAFGDIKVFNKEGIRVDTGDTRSVEKTGLEVDLRPLDAGTYTVLWKVTSVSDSHRSSGSFRFTVSGGGRLFLGTAGGATQALIDTRPTPANTGIRWAELVGLALIAGAVGSLIVVWRPLVRSVSDEARVKIGHRFRLLASIGLVVVAITLIADLFSRASGSTSENVGLALALRHLLLDSQFGPLFLSRLVLLILLGLLWRRAMTADSGQGLWALWLGAAVAGLLLLGQGLASHAAASETGHVSVSVASDFIHLAAACVWTGGLVFLLSGIEAVRRTDGHVVRRVISRFSNLSILCVGTIGITGLYNAWLEVGSFQAFSGTSYGQVLLVKSAILVPLLGLAAINLTGIRFGLTTGFRSRRKAEAEGGAHRLGFLVKGEVFLALLVLLMTALLANLPLARTTVAASSRASEAPMAMPVLLESRGMNLTLGVSPNRVGTNSFLLDLTDAAGNPITGNAEVDVRISRLGDDLALETLYLEPRGHGRYSTRSKVLSIVGTWIASVTVSIDGTTPLTIDYMFRVADRPQGSRSILKGIFDFLSGHEPELARTGPLIPSGTGSEAGLALLRKADVSMNRLSSLHECNNINGVITLLDYNTPDRMRYSVSGGGESIIGGSRQWYRRGGEPWQLRLRGEEFRFPDFSYADDSSGIRTEGFHLVDGRLHHVISFYNSRDDADYWFWIDAENHRISRLLMNVPPSHYMVSIFDRFDGPEAVSVPKGPEDDSVVVPQVTEGAPCASYLP